MQKYILLIILLLTNFVALSDTKDFDYYKTRFDNLLNTNPDSLFIEAGILKSISDENKNPELEGLAELYIAYFYQKKRIYEKALKQFFNAETYFIKANKKEYLGKIYSSIGASYRHTKDYEKSRLYFSKAIENISDDDVFGKAKALNRLGDIYRDIENIDSAFICYNESMKIANIKDTAVIANNYNNIGDLFMIQNKFDSSSYYYNKSLNILINTNQLSEIAENYTCLALLNLKFRKYNSAVDYITKSIYFLEGRYKDYELFNSYETAILIYSQINNKDSLIKYLHKIYDFEKQASSDRLKQNIAAIELEQNIKIIERDLNNIKKQNEAQTKINNLLIVIVILVIIAGVLAWRQFYNKKKENQLLIKQKEIIDSSNKKLQAAFDDIHQLNAMKDKFFSIIAHDLKNPIGSFRDITKMMYEMHDDFSDEERIEFLQLIKESSDKLYLLLENLLEWSRSQKNQLVYNPKKINLYDIVNNNKEIHSIIAENKRISLINNVAENTFVTADIDLLSTILRNLISNAIKFTPENGKVIIKSMHKDNFVIVSVKDSGIGMTQDVIEKLFRIDVNTTTLGTSQEKGSGLGLILCKEFVEKHGGTIWVESKPNEGSTFYFTLPK